MSVITIDATELHEAAPKVAALYATLAVSARQLRSVDVSCEMPAGLAGRVTAGVSHAAQDLGSAERTMNGMDADIRKRAQLAKIADAVGKITFGMGTLKLPADLIDAADKADEAAGAARRVSPAAAKVATAIKSVLGAVGAAADVFDVVSGARNPYLDDNRKASEAITKGGTAAALSVAGGVVVGFTAAPALPAVAIGVGIALGYTVLDKKFHIGDKVSDGVNSALDTAGEALDDAGEALEDVGEGIDDAADKAKDFVGGLF